MDDKNLKLSFEEFQAELKHNRFLCLTNDLLFKKIFGEKGSEAYLAALIAPILGVEENEIENVTYLNSEEPADAADGKAVRYDIRADIKLKNKPKILNVEMQAGNLAYYIERAGFYADRSSHSSLARGDDYKAIKPVLQINFIKGNLFGNKQDWLTVGEFRDRDTGDKLTNYFDTYYAEIDKYRVEKEIGSMTTFELLIKMLKSQSEEEFNMYSNANNAIINGVRDKALAYMGDSAVRRREYLLMVEKIDEAFRQQEMEDVRLELAQAKAKIAEAVAQAEARIAEAVAQAEREKAEDVRSKLAQAEARMAQAEARMAQAEARIAQAEREKAEAVAQAEAQAEREKAEAVAQAVEHAIILTVKGGQSLKDLAALQKVSLEAIINIAVSLNFSLDDGTVCDREFLLSRERRLETAEANSVAKVQDTASESEEDEEEDSGYEPEM